jgi:hypothetical protein
MKCNVGTSILENGEPTPVRAYLMGFGEALEELEAGHSVCRQGWNGKGQYLGLQRPDRHSANTLPYIYIITVQGDRVPWLASQTDLLAKDWMLKGGVGT